MTQPIQNNDIAKSFEKLVDSTFVKIGGVLVQIGININTGEDVFIWGNEWYRSESEVRKAMADACSVIDKSMIKQNK